MKLLPFSRAACRYFSSQAALVASSFPKLTNEQHQVLHAVRDKKSVFITGSAGTGKTFLLEQVIEELRKIHGQSQVYVTASTGVAACALNGQTLHSFSGVGVGYMDHKGLMDKVRLNKSAFRRWREVKALVIDEISMIDARLFDSLSHIARRVRDGVEVSDNGNKAWGGIQLIVSGDFFQLPPIPIKKEEEEEEETLFAFEADSWVESFHVKIELKTIFRQSDSRLIQLLQGIRKGEINPDELKLLEGCFLRYEVDPEAVRLYPFRSAVNKVNIQILESLSKEIHVYRAKDSGEGEWMKQLKTGIAPDELKLCVGARVMLIKNIQRPSRKLVNGATGTVVEFCKVRKGSKLSGMCSHGSVLPVVKFDFGLKLVVKPETWKVMVGDETVAKRKQIPLILSWALSIHKCQGMSLGKLSADLKRVFGFGMVYVALSRIRSLDGLHLSGFDPSGIKAHPNVLEFYRKFGSEKAGKTKIQ